jgi:hypothetical protein
LAHEKHFLDWSQALVRSGSFELVSKITRPQLGLTKYREGFSGSLGFFASFFDQAKNEDKVLSK